MAGHPGDCPECRAGKHGLCADFAIDEETDEVIPCPCAEGGHA